MYILINVIYRVYSTVIGNGRTLQEDTVICGYKIPKGVNIIYNYIDWVFYIILMFIWCVLYIQVQTVFPTIVTGNMEEYVTDASAFKPERWMRGAEGEIHPYASLPYGHGARMCLGRRFADLEIQILLAKVLYYIIYYLFSFFSIFNQLNFAQLQLVRSYRLEFHHKPLKYAVTFMYAPDGELKFKMVKR